MYYEASEGETFVFEALFAGVKDIKNVCLVSKYLTGIHRQCMFRFTTC